MLGFWLESWVWMAPSWEVSGAPSRRQIDQTASSSLGSRCLQSTKPSPGEIPRFAFLSRVAKLHLRLFPWRFLGRLACFECFYCYYWRKSFKSFAIFLTEMFTVIMQTSRTVRGNVLFFYRSECRMHYISRQMSPTCLCYVSFLLIQVSRSSHHMVSNWWIFPPWKQLL